MPFSRKISPQTAELAENIFNFLSLRSAVNKKKTDLTAEHAEIAEKQNTLAVPGEAGIFHAFLSALSELCGELLVSFSI